jgi:Ner family transcriptional regulator
MANQDWHNADIIAEVRKAVGLSLRQLSIQNQLNPGACQQALHRPYETPEKIISDAIGVPAHLIWPTRYNQNGARKPRLYANSITIKHIKNTKNANAPTTRGASK